MTADKGLVPIELIQNRIIVLRDEKVMIDRDIAELYGVSTKALNQAVTRNMKRFPPDFMFRVTRTEKEQLVTNCDRFGPLKHSSAMPRAFTEQGIAMLSSILNVDRAIDVNIAIMRAFVQLRKISSSQKQLAQRLYEIEVRLENHDENIEAIFEAIRQLMTPIERPRKKIGFEVSEPKGRYGKRTRKKEGWPGPSSRVQVLSVSSVQSPLFEQDRQDSQDVAGTRTLPSGDMTI